MQVDLNNIVRTAGATIAALSLTLPLGITIALDSAQNRASAKPTAAAAVLQDITDELTLACVQYRISNADSSLERSAKTAIDEYFGGQVSYKNICGFVLG